MPSNDDDPTTDARPKRTLLRKDGRLLRRLTVYLPETLARHLTIESAHSEDPVSEIICDAVERELELRAAVGSDKISHPCSKHCPNAKRQRRAA